MTACKGCGVPPMPNSPVCWSCWQTKEYLRKFWLPEIPFSEPVNDTDYPSAEPKKGKRRKG